MRRSSSLRALLLWCAAASISACGSTESAPTAPREAHFDVNPGPGDRRFTVVEIRGANALHHPEGTYTAPHSFILENIQPPIQGIFSPAGSDSVSDVQLILGGETVPRRVNTPAENPATCSPPLSDPPSLCVNTGAPVEPATSGAPEVRFEVTTATRIPFAATVGDRNNSFLVGSAQAPATLFIEDARERVTGVFAKRESTAELTVRLFVGGREVDADTSPAGQTRDAVVKYEF